jgi:UDP-N-acetylmuramyl tripeptide synthase
MRVDQLIAGLQVTLADPAMGSARVCDITEYSRTVMPGSLYIARRGEHADGRDFVKGAVEAGAVAVLTDDPGLKLARRAVALLVTDECRWPRR